MKKILIFCLLCGCSNPYIKNLSLSKKNTDVTTEAGIFKQRYITEQQLPYFKTTPPPIHQIKEQDNTINQPFIDYPTIYEQQARIMIQYLFSVENIWPWQQAFIPGTWSLWNFYKTYPPNQIQDYLATARIAYSKLVGINWWVISFKTNKYAITFKLLINPQTHTIDKVFTYYPGSEATEILIDKSNPMFSPNIIEQSLITKNIKDIISVPAGNFPCDIISYQPINSKKNIILYKNDTSTGGLLKYSVSGPNDTYIFHGELIAHGKLPKPNINKK